MCVLGLTQSWSYCMTSCLVAWRVGWAQGEGPCQCRFRSNPIKEHLDREGEKIILLLMLQINVLYL